MIAEPIVVKWLQLVKPISHIVLRLLMYWLEQEAISNQAAVISEPSTVAFSKPDIQCKADEGW